jgi:hypothetical protein
MLAPGRATYSGAHAHVIDAVHEPKGLQEPRIPILVGGNGPNRTWRLAARFADELNLDAMTPERLAGALPIIRDRCEEIGRDPSSLRISVHLWGEPMAVGDGPERVERLLAYAELGVDRVMVQGFVGMREPARLAALFEDCRAAGLITG